MMERRPRRRRRRLSRARAGALAGALVLVLLLAAVVGGALRAGSQSTPYQRSVDRSYALEVRDIVTRATLLDRQLHALLKDMPRERRLALESTLDTLVRSADALAAAARTAGTPAPWGPVGAEVALAMSERARAVSDLRTLVDRLLGMSPLPGAASAQSVTARPPRPISATGAAEALGRVSDLLARADRTYAEARRALRSAPGRAVIPPSAWASRAVSWSSGTALSFVDALTSSSTLVAVHDVELVTHATVLTPAPVPPSPTATGPSTAVLPPTGRVVVTAVVANRGNVAERGVVVEASLRPAGGAGGRRITRRRSVSLGVHDAVSVVMPPLGVVPNHHYTITVSVVPPRPDPPGAVTTDTLTTSVAPPAAPVVGQLSPNKGPAGTILAIFGSGFTWVTSVDFGTTRARFVVRSSGQMTVLVPTQKHGSGPVAVRVTNPGGTSAPSPADRFTYRTK